jgi:hypothetical protein
VINETITRIRETVEAVKLVGGAVQFQVAAESNPKAVPACFVIPLEESPSPNEMDSFVIQRVAATIGVVLVVRNVADKTGEAAGQDMEILRKAVKAQLMGWQPSAEYDPLERGRSGLLAFKDGHMWWQDIYLTSYIDRSVL